METRPLSCHLRANNDKQMLALLLFLVRNRVLFKYIEENKENRKLNEKKLASFIND